MLLDQYPYPVRSVLKGLLAALDDLPGFLLSHSASAEQRDLYPLVQCTGHRGLGREPLHTVLWLRALDFSWGELYTLPPLRIAR